MGDVRMRRGRRWRRRAGIVVAAGILGFPILVAALGLVIGLVAAAFGLVIALGVTIGPWVALGYGIYWFSRRSARKRRAQAAWGPPPQWQPVTVPPAAPPPPPPAPHPVDPAQYLPSEERDQVGRIRRKAAVLMQQADRFPTGSRHIFLVQRMLGEYLPSTLDAYLALPPGTAQLPITPDRRTGVEVLRSQLEILESKLDEAESDLRQVNVDRLLANERFLEQHFGRPPDSELTIPEERNRTA